MPETTSTQPTALAGNFTLPNADITVKRMGYGAMQLAGPHVFGPPRDRAAAIAVLREAIDSGVDHIDTSDFYGPHITNQILKEALHPYPAHLTIVTKVGARRGDKGEWIQMHDRQFLIDSVHDNLRNLKLEVLDVVNVRATGMAEPEPAFDIRPSMEVLAELQRQGLVRHIGVSNVSPEQTAAAQTVAPVVCVQNNYNLANRGANGEKDLFIADLARQGIPYVPYFPLGGFSPLQSSTLDTVAASLGATPMQVALAWLLQHSPNILLIPGTSSVAHLRENLAAAALHLPPEAIAELNGIGTQL